MKKLGFAALAAMSLCASPVMAQDAEIERNNLDWWYVTYANFDDDKREWVEEWQENVIIPAHEAAGMRPPIFVHMNTGNWDMIIFNHMPEGPDMMTWASNPMGEKLNAEALKIVGSQEDLDAGRKAYDAAFTRTSGGLGHIDINDDGDGDDE